MPTAKKGKSVNKPVEDAPAATGGALNGFTVSSLMQLIETDQRTCFVQIRGQGLQRGTMAFLDGEPLDAACGRLTGDQAVLEMIGWDSASIDFLDPPALLPKKTVASGTMGLIIEGMRLKDERIAEEDGDEDNVDSKNESLPDGGKPMAGLKQMMKDIADELDGVIAVGVIGMDGITVAAHNPTGADMDVVSAKFAMVMKLVDRSVADLSNLGNFEENLVQTANAWILTRFLDKQYYLTFIVSREGTLGNVRLVAKKYLEQVQRAI